MRAVRQKWTRSAAANRLKGRRPTSSSKVTTDHDEIRRWVEERGGHPAKVRTGGEGGILRIDFGDPDPNLERISWEEFFRIFEENNLAFLYQDKTESGGISRFNKFVDREREK